MKLREKILTKFFSYMLRGKPKAKKTSEKDMMRMMEETLGSKTTPETFKGMSSKDKERFLQTLMKSIDKMESKKKTKK